MITLKLSALESLFHCAATSGERDLVFKGVVTDTREDCQGALFIALKGDNFDGHDFVAGAYEKGAVIALVEHQVDCQIPQIVVDNSLIAFGLLANYWRHQIKPLVIGITGSNGKTTVKEMLFNILRNEFKTLATIGNLNNEIGVPKTLCQLSDSDEIAIIEMGANHADEIKRLSAIAEPNIVYVNNASATHVEGFGSLDGVRKAKGELYQFANSEALVLINLDDPAALQWQNVSASKQIYTLSLNEHSADFNAISKGNELEVSIQQEQFTIALKVKGLHNHSNALAALSLARLAQSSTASIVKGLETFTGFKGRLQFFSGVKGSTIIDDSYNANPTSFRAGINVLCDLQGEAWIAMGDMGELGSDAQLEHDNVISFAKHQGVKAVFAKGAMSQKATRLMPNQAHSFDSFEGMSEAIKKRIGNNVNLLVKGSRSAHMEELVRLLTKEVS